MIVVSDSSVLINLAWLNHLDLLKELYEEVTIPQAVWDEIVVSGRGKPGSQEVQVATWIKTATPKNVNLVKSLQLTIDRGEAESIALAIEVNADLLLMDERLGRSTARYFNLNVVGLIDAKRKGLISAVRPLMDQLRNVVGFHISNQLYQQVLTIIQE